MSRPTGQLVLFGAQGSGKGTQTQRLAEHFGSVAIGAGDLLRKMGREDTLAGRKVAPIVKAGKLVPDDIISEVIALQLESLPQGGGFVLEGYPRTVEQAGQFKATLERLGREAAGTVFISLDTPREVLKQRLMDRQRHDDTAELIERRLRIYEEQTTPVLDAVGAWATVLHVDGDQPVEAVTETIINQLSDAKAEA